MLYLLKKTNMDGENLLTRFDEMVKKFRHEFSEIVESERAKIKAEIEAYKAEKERIEAVNVRDDDLINLNVGGTKITTTRSTLCQVENSLLAAMFSGRWEDNIKRDQDGAVFFDFNPQHFILVLDYLRVKKIETPENPPPLPKVPEDQEKSFNSLVRYLGLSNEIIAPSKIMPSEKFNSCSPGISIQEDGLVAVHDRTSDHKYVLGENVYSEGTVNLKLKLESFKNNWWTSVGVAQEDIKRPLDLDRFSCNWSGSYGWGLGLGGGGVYKNASSTTDKTLRNASKQGDTVKLVLDCEAGKLSLHLPTGQKFHIDIPKGKTWRLIVNLYSSNDKIRILEDQCATTGLRQLADDKFVASCQQTIKTCYP